MKAFAVVLGLLIAGAMLALALRGNSSPLASAVGLVVSPLQGLSIRLSHALEDFGANFRSSQALQQALAARDAEIAKLRSQLVDYSNTRKKLDIYKNFLGLKEDNPNFQLAEADIIGVGERYTSFTLSKGALFRDDAGNAIEPGNPVLFGEYLVGVVTKVDSLSCIVETLLNPNVYVSVYETGSGDIGVANTAAEEFVAQGLCAVPQLEPSSALLNPGALICTSGRGDIFPKDLILGTVLEKRNDSQNLRYISVITPAVDFSALRSVMILIGQ